LSFTTLDSWVSIDIKNYNKGRDYTYTLTFNQQLESIEVKITILNSIQDTKIIAKLSDKSKIKTVSGKMLQNEESELELLSITLASEQVANMLVAVKDMNIGNLLGTAGVGAVIVSATLGNSFSFLAKFILIIEFLGLIQLFNVEYEVILDLLFEVLASFTKFTMIPLPCETALRAQHENNLPGQWRAKLSIHEIAPWLLQDIGAIGIMLALVYGLQLLALSFFKDSKANKIIQNIRIGLFNQFIVDYAGLTLRTLAHSTSNPMNHILKLGSFILANFFLLCFVYEVIFGYIQTNSLYLRDKKSLDPIEKDLAGFYYEGLDRKSLESSWWVRNYNLIFIVRFMLVSVFIYAFQFLQMLQVSLSLLLLLFICVCTLFMSFKLKFFKSKLTKIVRIFQEVSFTLILVFVGLFYMEKPYNSLLSH
jgi:hypothetical protein